MTDQAVLATFMEPMMGHGWCWDDASELGLNSLWKVEARLTDEQWWAYEKHLSAREESRELFYGESALLAIVKLHIHASAEQKVAALAKVLRGEVKG